MGKIATAGGRGECRRRKSSSAGTVDRTSARSESRRERSRLARAGTAWLPTKARAFNPDERIISKLACAEGWRASRNPEMVESHQPSQDIVSPMPWSVRLGSGALCRVPTEKGQRCGKNVGAASWGMG